MLILRQLFTTYQVHQDCFVNIIIRLSVQIAKKKKSVTCCRITQVLRITFVRWGNFVKICMRVFFSYQMTGCFWRKWNSLESCLGQVVVWLFPPSPVKLWLVCLSMRKIIYNKTKIKNVQPLQNPLKTYQDQFVHLTPKQNQEWPSCID